MPHVDNETKTKLNTTEQQVVKMGDACFLFANLALQMYNVDPSWTTIHKVRVMCRTPWHDEQAHALIRAKMGHMSKVDVDTAADLAFFEFYRIIGAGHEDCKIIENGSAFEGAKIPQPVLKEAVTSNEQTESVPTLQGVGEAGKRGRKRLDNPTV